MSRIENSSRNFIMTVFSFLITTVISFINRSFFISILGISALGLNSLFTNLISMLSLTELGVGAAITYSLYKPIANDDKEMIKSLMHLYKKFYQLISLIIFTLGILFIPFLDVFLKGTDGLDNVLIIYIIFLFNSAYSYLFSYKRTLLLADQKAYLTTLFDLIKKILTLIVQIVVLIKLESFILYLLVSVFFGVIENIYINRFVNKKYEYLSSQNLKKLSKNEIKPIVKNVKAMFLHKIGDLSVNQTDNLIISSFVSVTAVGYISNYYLIINMLNNFIVNLFTATTASWGNLIATASEHKRIRVFRGYNFLAFWFYGVASVCIYILINPFITLWLGEDRVLNSSIVSLLVMNFYLVGLRVPVNNVKEAAGLYSKDKYVPLIQAGINVSVSIVLVNFIGIAGVFLGTIISSLSAPFWYKPIIVYKYVFKSSSKEYFKNFTKYFMTVLLNIVIMSVISKNIFNIFSLTWLTFIIVALSCLIIPNILLIMLFNNTEEYQYIIGIIKEVIKGIRRRKKTNE